MECFTIKYGDCEVEMKTQFLRGMLGVLMFIFVGPTMGCPEDFGSPYESGLSETQTPSIETALPEIEIQVYSSTNIDIGGDFTVVYDKVCVTTAETSEVYVSRPLSNLEFYGAESTFCSDEIPYVSDQVFGDGLTISILMIELEGEGVLVDWGSDKLFHYVAYLDEEIILEEFDHVGTGIQSFVVSPQRLLEIEKYLESLFEVPLPQTDI